MCFAFLFSMNYWFCCGFISVLYELVTLCFFIRETCLSHTLLVDLIKSLTHLLKSSLLILNTLENTCFLICIFRSDMCVYRFSRLESFWWYYVVCLLRLDEMGHHWRSGSEMQAHRWCIVMFCNSFTYNRDDRIT